GEQMGELLASGLDEAGVRTDTHDRLGDSERDDLCISQDPPGVLRRFRQEIVSRTEHGNQQQVEVGEHRVPPGSTVRIGTADFDLTVTRPYLTAATPAVELLIERPQRASLSMTPRSRRLESSWLKTQPHWTNVREFPHSSD